MQTVPQTEADDKPTRQAHVGTQTLNAPNYAVSTLIARATRGTLLTTALRQYCFFAYSSCYGYSLLAFVWATTPTSFSARSKARHRSVDSPSELRASARATTAWSPWRFHFGFWCVVACLGLSSGETTEDASRHAASGSNSFKQRPTLASHL